VQAVRAVGGSWQVGFWVVGMAGLIWIPMWFVLVRGVNLRGGRPVEPGSYAPPAEDSRRLLVIRFLCLMVVVVTINLTWQFLRAWLPKFLKEYHHYSESTADYFTAGYYLATDAGCILSGLLVPLLVKRGWQVFPARTMAFGICAMFTLAAVAIPYVEKGPLLLILLMLAGAGTLGLNPHYYALAQELPHRNMGLISGILAASTWLMVAEMQGRIGAYIEKTGQYDPGFIISGVAPLIGLAAILVLGRFVRRTPA
jgi:MFS transporter, ACS family, hexuronate transporter